MDSFVELVKKFWLLVAGSIVTLTVLATAVLYVSQTLDEGELIEVTGRTQTSFDVFYIENTLFPGNPVPARFHFIRQLTDYIEFTSGFSATFSEPMNVTYTYTARMRFVVNYAGAGTPMIYEEVNILTQVEGSVFTSHLFFNPAVEGTPGGVYRIELDEFERKFDDFVEYTVRLQGEGTDEGFAIVRNFSASLEIDFVYNLRVPHHGINETVTNSFNIPIGLSVFSLASTGPPGFTASIVAAPDAVALSMPLIIGLLALFILGGLGIYFGYQNLDFEENENRRKANDIIKKYGTEIVVSTKPLDILGLKVMMVDDFEDILKLAINLSKHINCYKDSTKAEFVTVVDYFAYCHRIEYGTKKPVMIDYDEDEDIE